MAAPVTIKASMCTLGPKYLEYKHPKLYSVQLAVETQLIYCTVCTMYKNYMFRPILAIFRFFVYTRE